MGEDIGHGVTVCAVSGSKYQIRVSLEKPGEQINNGTGIYMTDEMLDKIVEFRRRSRKSKTVERSQDNDFSLGDCVYVRPPVLGNGEIPIPGCVQLHVRQKGHAENQPRPFIVIQPGTWVQLKKYMAEIERQYPGAFLDEGETAEEKILAAWKKELVNADSE